MTLLPSQALLSTCPQSSSQEVNDSLNPQPSCGECVTSEQMTSEQMISEQMISELLYGGASPGTNKGVEVLDRTCPKG